MRFARRLGQGRVRVRGPHFSLVMNQLKRSNQYGLRTCCAVGTARTCRARGAAVAADAKCAPLQTKYTLKLQSLPSSPVSGARHGRRGPGLHYARLCPVHLSAPTAVAPSSHLAVPMGNSTPHSWPKRDGVPKGRRNHSSQCRACDPFEHPNRDSGLSPEVDSDHAAITLSRRIGVGGRAG